MRFSTFRLHCGFPWRIEERKQVKVEGLCFSQPWHNVNPCIMTFFFYRRAKRNYAIVRTLNVYFFFFEREKLNISLMHKMKCTSTEKIRNNILWFAVHSFLRSCVIDWNKAFKYENRMFFKRLFCYSWAAGLKYYIRKKRFSVFYFKAL